MDLSIFHCYLSFTFKLFSISDNCAREPTNLHNGQNIGLVLVPSVIYTYLECRGSYSYTLYLLHFLCGKTLYVSLSLFQWYPGSGVVLDCIDSWSLHPYLLLLYIARSYEIEITLYRDTIHQHHLNKSINISCLCYYCHTDVLLI